MLSIETVTLLISALNLLVVALGIGFAARQVVLARKSLEEITRISGADHDWNRRIAAQSALSDYNSSLILSKLHKELDYLNRTEAIPLADIENAFGRDPELQTELFRLLNFYEAMARGIQQGVYDEEIVKSARRTAILKAFRSFAGYIEQRRIQSRSPRAWCEFTSLASKWINEENQTVSREAAG